MMSEAGDRGDGDVPAIGQSEIEERLRAMGLGEGDCVMLHSALSSLGRVDGGAETVIAAFLAVLGKTGTLVVPTFGKLGIITDVLRSRPDAENSIHPMASVAAVGAGAAELCQDHWKPDLAHGPDTPYSRLIERGGYMCLLGVDLDRATLLHTPEELLRLPYMKTTKTCAFDTPEGEVTRSWPFFPGPHRDFIGLDRMLRESGRMRVGRIGNAVVRLIKAADLVKLGTQAGRANLAFVLCDNPNCAACVGQRADLRRALFGGAPFRVAASALLAGRYIEEIAENCAAAGIDAVELDGLRGQPVQMLKPIELGKAVADLRAAGCEVTALRLSADANNTEDVLVAAANARVPRVVLPLSSRAGAYAVRARDLGLTLSFSNVAVGSQRVSEALQTLKGQGSPVGFTFSPAQFAAAGELPFLGSYKLGLKRFIDQLDVEDGLYDGTPTALAQGNAEIKELISILGAASFSGHMVLGAGNRGAGTLLDAARAFARLLDVVAAVDG